MGRSFSRELKGDKKKFKNDLLKGNKDDLLKFDKLL